MTALAIFLGVYFVLAVGRLPGFRVDRTGAAIIGAALMVGAGVLTLDQAYRAINFDTIVLLFGMMMVAANLRLSGFFTVAGAWAVERARRPLALLAAIVAVSGALSAVFVNDTMCLVLTPLVAEITVALKRNPVPYLLGVAMASNIGSAATITGNPQNMLIGSYSGIPYARFAAASAPVAAIGLVATVAAIYLFHRDEFRHSDRLAAFHHPHRLNRPLMWKALAVSAGMLAFFFAGWAVPKVAVVGGAVLLLTRRVKPAKIYVQVDWPLLVMFAGLFVVVAGMEQSGLEQRLAEAVASLRLDNVYVLTALAAAISNIVSNVPAVLIFKPFLAHMAHPERAWLTLAASSTLAGNLTVVGSIANLIVVERARGQARIGFWDYARVGIPLTLATLAMAAVRMSWLG